MIKRALLVPLCLSAALLAGCSGASGTEGLSDVTSKLAEIRSGDLTLRIVATTEVADGGTAGFELSGPFEFSEAATLPEVDWQVTRFIDGEDSVSRFVSTGERAFVDFEGETIELTAEQVGAIAGTHLTGLDGLHLDRWVEDPEVSEDDGVTTVEGELDLAAVVNDLTAVALQSSTQLSDEEAEQLAEATRESSIRLVTDADGFLTSLDAEVTLSAEVPAGLAEAGLGDLVGASIVMHLEIGGINETVEVPLPAEASP